MAGRTRRRGKPSYLEALMGADPPNLYKRKVDDFIGFGLFTSEDIEMSSYIAEYKGEMITAEVADERENHKYMFYFKHAGSDFCVDAYNIKQSGIARFANDDWRKPNARVLKEVVQGRPVLFLKALKDIRKGEQIMYDYGDTSAPWRCAERPEFYNCIEEIPRCMCTDDSEYSEDAAIVGLLFSGIKKPADKVEIDNFLKSYSTGPRITIFEKFCPSVTHVIIIPGKSGENFVSERSLKYFQGVAHRCWVLDILWIIRSNEAGKLLPEREFLISEDSALGAVLGPQRAKAISPPFLNGKQVFIHIFTEDRGELGMTMDEIKDLIVCCGGEIVESVDQAAIVLSSYYDDIEVSKDDEKLFLGVYEQYRILTVSVYWLLDCISNYEEQTTDFYTLNKVIPSSAVSSASNTTVPPSSLPVTMPTPGMLDGDFSGELCGWSQDTIDDIDRLRNRGGTSATGAIPSSDHTNGVVEPAQDDEEWHDEEMDDSFCDENWEPDPDESDSSSDNESQSDRDSVTESSLDACINPQENNISASVIASKHDDNAVEDVVSSSSLPPVHADNDKVSSVIPSTSGGIVIQIANKTSQGKRTGKLHCCLFCDKYYARISRHYQQVHKNETDVARILSLPKRSKDRKRLWTALVNRGNYEHNFQVLKKGQGFLIPKYRPRKEEERKYNQYAPCEYCLGSYIIGDLWKHQKTCAAKSLEDCQKQKTKNRNIIQRSRLLWPLVGENKGFFDNIFTKMHEDDIKIAVGSDSLILSFADRMYEKNGSKEHQHQYIAQKVRELGRLRIQIRQDYPEIDCLKKAILPCNWNKLIDAVRNVSGYIPGEDRYEIPSLPLKLGHSLSKCALIVRKQAIMERALADRSNADDFLTLHADEWEARVSSGAHVTLNEAKYNNPLYVPLAEDVVLLNKHLQQRAVKLKTMLEEEPAGVEYYSELAEVCLAQLILFNRKRSGEAQRITLENYHTGTVNVSIPDSDVGNCLSKFELELCKTHKRIEIRGKRGSKVPVLLTESIQKNIATLLEARNMLREPVSSNYLFVKPGSQNPLRGSDCLRKFARQCNANMPHLLTSTRLRKHLATMSQILGLSEGSQDMLAKFMGHDIRVHRKFYRLPENTLELAKVTKVLHLINSGGIAKFQGQDFDEIEFNPQTEVEEEEEEEEESEEEGKEEDEDEEETQSENEETVKEEGGDKGKKDLNIIKKDFGKRRIALENPEISQSKRAKKAMPARHTWTLAEKEAIERQLGSFLRQGKTPGQLPCLNATKKEPILAQYSWENIKHATRNMIVSRKRKVMKQ